MFNEIAGHQTFAAGDLDPSRTRPVVVLVHGAAMDHTVWTYHTRYFLHIGRAVWVPDLPGHGRSEGPLCSSVEDMADWLASAADALGIERLALAGHSMGALVALDFASRYADRVEKLALLGAAVPMSVAPQLLDEAQKNSQLARDMMMVWGHGQRALMGGNRVAGINIIKPAMRLLEKAAPGVLFNDLNACNAYEAGLDAATRVSAPTRLICGRDDRMTPMRAAQNLAQQIDACSIDTIEGSGHIMMGEQPEATHRCLTAALA